MSGPDVDTRSDIYSLGVLLYELLTGSTPLERRRLREAAFTEVLRRIREEEPPKPSTRLSTTGGTASIAASRGTEPARLSRLVRGDLDWIVMKALEKDPARRYETANGLARDIRRHLEGDPVEAGPPSAIYRLRKLGRKHRAALATAAIVAAVLVAATAISTWQAIRATRAEEQARSEPRAGRSRRRSTPRRSAADSQAVLDFFRNKVLAAARPAGQDGGLGRDVKLRDVLDQRRGGHRRGLLRPAQGRGGHPRHDGPELLPARRAGPVDPAVRAGPGVTGGHRRARPSRHAHRHQQRGDGLPDRRAGPRRDPAVRAGTPGHAGRSWGPTTARR